MVQAVFENFEKKGNKTSTKFRNRKKYSAFERSDFEHSFFVG